MATPNVNIAQVLQSGQTAAMPQWRQGMPADLSAPLGRLNQNLQNAYAIRQERLKNAIDQLSRIGQDQLASGDESQAHDTMRQFMPIMNERYGTNIVGPEGFFRKEVPGTPGSAGVQRHGTSVDDWAKFQQATSALSGPNLPPQQRASLEATLNQIKSRQPGIGEFTQAPRAATPGRTEYDTEGMGNYFNVGHRPEVKQDVHGGFLFTSRDGRPVGKPTALPMTPEQLASLQMRQDTQAALNEYRQGMLTHNTNMEGIARRNAETSANKPGGLQTFQDPTSGKTYAISQLPDGSIMSREVSLPANVTRIGAPNSGATGASTTPEKFAAAAGMPYYAANKIGSAITPEAARAEAIAAMQKDKAKAAMMDPDPNKPGRFDPETEAAIAAAVASKVSATGAKAGSNSSANKAVEAKMRAEGWTPTGKGGQWVKKAGASPAQQAGPDPLIGVLQGLGIDPSKFNQAGKP